MLRLFLAAKLPGEHIVAFDFIHHEVLVLNLALLMLTSTSS